MRRFLAALAVVVACNPGPAGAQGPAGNWYDNLVPERSFNFGTVARGSKLKHSFEFINTSKYDVHIADTRAKCGCTDVKLGARSVPPGTKTVIEATLDTTKFVGYKPSGLTLVIDQPQFLEIDLALACFIRGDVLVNPGIADFGVVARGTGPQVAMNFTYAGGQANFQVTDIKTLGTGVSAKITETGRAGGQVQYQIVATLDPKVSPGFFKDELRLYTTDPNSPQIPISVAANVQAAVTLVPSTLVLGQIKAGTTVTKDILVRSSKPFKVVKATSKGGEATAPADEGSTILHKMKITVKAPAASGPFNAVFEVSTDLAGEPSAKLPLFATVVP